jgi:outer membrane immunogenic protein
MKRLLVTIAMAVLFLSYSGTVRAQFTYPPWPVADVARVGNPCNLPATTELQKIWQTNNCPRPGSGSPFNWSGFYVGVNGGGMGFNTNGTFAPNNPDFGWHTDGKQVGVGGIHGGFQVQSGQLVFGIEGAWDAAFNSPFGSTVGGGLGGSCGFGSPDSCQARINDILQVGPRVGLAVNNWMVYGTGGFARAMIDTRGFDPVANTGFFAASNHQNGWYVGGGMDLKIGNGLVVGIEYKHFDFNSAIQMVPGAPADDRTVKASSNALLIHVSVQLVGFRD